MRNEAEASAWPDELDAVIAAPKHHRVLFEDDAVRVLETIIEPGEIVPLHTHRWPAVTTFLAVSDVVRRNEAGEILFASAPLFSEPMPQAQANATPPLGPHTLENVGTRRFHAITVELKPPS